MEHIHLEVESEAIHSASRVTRWRHGPEDETPECRILTPSGHPEGRHLLFIEYDVTPSGDIALVALINAVEEDRADEDGSDWMAWRAAEFDDDGLGCVGVPPDQLTVMEQTRDPDLLRAIVERIILADRAIKEQHPS